MFKVWLQTTPDVWSAVGWTDSMSGALVMMARIDPEGRESFAVDEFTTRTTRETHGFLDHRIRPEEYLPYIRDERTTRIRINWSKEGF